MTLKKIAIIILCCLSGIYLLNPTAGFFEILPDNIPFIGNLDEGLATYVFFSCIQYLRGKKVGLFAGNANSLRKRENKS